MPFEVTFIFNISWLLKILWCPLFPLHWPPLPCSCPLPRPSPHYCLSRGYAWLLSPSRPFLGLSFNLFLLPEPRLIQLCFKEWISFLPWLLSSLVGAAFLISVRAAGTSKAADNKGEGGSGASRQYLALCTSTCVCWGGVVNTPSDCYWDVLSQKREGSLCFCSH